MEFADAALQCFLAEQTRKLAEEKARHARVTAARRKIAPLVRKVASRRLTPLAAMEQIKRLVPDEALAREVLRQVTSSAPVSPALVTRQQEQVQRLTAKSAHWSRLRKLDAAVHDGLKALSRMAAAGDADAAWSLVAAAQQAAALVAEAQNTCPDLLRAIARKQTRWPVLAGEEPGWEKTVAARVAALDLAAEYRFLNVRFREARGTEANLPARRWAKAAVRTVEETRWRWEVIHRLRDHFGGSQTLAGFVSAAGWSLPELPQWASRAVHLPAFARSSLPQWKAVVRDLIREQLPAFHTFPEWTSQRNTALANGRGTRGELQNAILDDISSALARLAPP